MIVTVVLEQLPGNWCAHAPDLDDVVVATGATREETISRFREALRGLAQLKQEEGKAFPAVTNLQILETIAA